jgi:predicted metal-dependent peptidase
MTMLSIGKQLTAEQRLSKAVVDIMPRIPEIAGLLMIGDRSVVDNIPTACTNGRDEMYGRGFIDTLNDAELRFLVLHEVFHKMYRHLITWAHLWKLDSRTANVAMDYDINGKIIEEYGQDGWVKMPEGGCHDLKYKGWGTAKIFWGIYDPDAANDQPQGGKPDDGHPDGFDEHDWEGAQDMTADEQREIAREVDEAIRQGALVAGKIGDGASRSLDELLQPQIDWREVLREFISTTCAGSDYSTWQRPNRRYVAGGYYMPSGISESVGELVIAIDTSGSIGQVELSHFLSEVKSICDTVHPDAIRLLYWDTRVCQDEKYAMHELDDIVKSTKPKGGGGTSVECVPEYLTEHGVKPQAAIVLTDGYLGGSWGQWSCPVLWCILDNKQAVPDVGTCVNIKSGDM